MPFARLGQYHKDIISVVRKLEEIKQNSYCYSKLPNALWRAGTTWANVSMMKLDRCPKLHLALVQDYLGEKTDVRDLQR